MRRRGSGRGQPDLTPRPGAVAPDLVREYGPLDLWHTRVAVSARAQEEGRERLHRLSDSYHPADALRVHGRPAAHEAYRAFARQVGLDPDVDPLPVEAVAREAAVAGRLPARGAVMDALLAVAVTSGVPVTAIDARTVDGEPTLRTAATGERLGRGRRWAVLAPGTIVVADALSPLAPLFGDPAPGHDGRRARDVWLVAVGVPGVPVLEVSEAVWTAARHLTLS